MDSLAVSLMSPANQEPALSYYVTISQGLLAPVIAVFGIWFARRQWQTDRARLRHELFDRRYKIFRAAIDYLTLIMNAKLTPEVQREYWAGIQGDHFLLGPEVSKHLREIWNRSLIIERNEAIIRDLPSGPNDERKKLVGEIGETKIWAFEQIAVVDRLFSKYLEFRGVR